MKVMTLAVAAFAMLIPEGAAHAAGSEGQGRQVRNTPPNFPYEIRDGRRVPRVPRVVHPDGSWTEEIRQGNCTITRTGRDGEVREVRKCD